MSPVTSTLPVMDDQLHCGRCKQDKPDTEFNKNAARRNRTGHDNYCRECMATAGRARREARKGEAVPEADRCDVPGCTDRRKGHGYCNRHLKRFRKHGSPLAGRAYGKKTQVPRRPVGLTLEESFRWYMPGAPPQEGVPWLWRGPVDGKGYGAIPFEGRSIFAHRVAYELFIGPIPEGMLVRHKNDTPLDVNPHNLEPGTRIDNVRDRVERGRSYSGLQSQERRAKQARGSRHPLAKLTEEHIPLIRAAYRRGETQTSIAQQFGTSQVAISMIVRGKTWTHVP